MSFSLSRPRLPLSPASPPDSGIKHEVVDHRAAVAPQTPPSPAHSGMSVATKRYVSSYENSRHTDEMADRSTPEIYSQSTHRAGSTANTTPSQQHNVLKRPLPQDGEERLTSKRQKKDVTELDIEANNSFAATNHDRQAASNGLSIIEIDEDATMQEAVVNPVDEHVFQGPAQKAFLVGSSTHSRAQIDISRHLLGSFGLHPLLETVARTEPQPPFEKINKLRKSYEGQIKIAGLSGRNKPYREERDPEDGGISKLRKLATMPEEEFEEKQPERRIGDLSGLRDKLQIALRLNPGTMKQQTTNEWDEILGHEVQKSKIPPSQSQLATQHLQQARINGVRPLQNVASAVPGKMATRGKKRSYDDSSYSGYPGYGDGLSEPEEQSDRDRDWTDRGKKRRKD